MRISILVWLMVSLLFACGPSPWKKHQAGDAVDSIHGVKVYYNGDVSATHGRNLTPDGYNLGLKYQCVEFIKRYYHEHLHHKMPDSYGHAKSFFNPEIADGDLNANRGLFQYTNGSESPPQVSDIIIFDGHTANPYGHVAIISKVSDTEIEIIQQNPGRFGDSRANYSLNKEGRRWYIQHPRVLGWLRKRRNL